MAGAASSTGDAAHRSRQAGCCVGPRAGSHSAVVEPRVYSNMGDALCVLGGLHYKQTL